MPSTSTNSVDTVSGTIDFSQITTGGSTYTGSGVLATVTFKVVGVGATDLIFDFTLGNTRDSNVACCEGVDVLASATGAQFIIDGPVGGSVTGVSPSRVDCRNATTGQRVNIRDGMNFWDCEQKGLVVHPEDRVTQQVTGIIQAETIRPTAKALLSHQGLTQANPIDFKVDFGIPFHSLDMVTLDAFWVGDGLDEGEEIRHYPK